MKLPVRFGLPLLLVLLAGLTLFEGPERTTVLVAAMLVALWTALSLPRPPPEEMETGPFLEGQGDETEGGDAGADEKPGEDGDATENTEDTEDTDNGETGNRD